MINDFRSTRHLLQFGNSNFILYQFSLTKIEHQFNLNYLTVSHKNQIAYLAMLICPNIIQSEALPFIESCASLV